VRSRVLGTASWTRALARSSAVPLLVALVLGWHSLPAGGQGAGAPALDPVAVNVRTTKALIAALEREDLEGIQARLSDEIQLVLPLAPDGNNDPTHVDQFAGRQAFRNLMWRTFLAYRRIAFVDSVITPSSDGQVIFVEARGDFLTLDGRSYRNVYLIKLVFDDVGAVTRIEEWTNPVTAALTWGFPLSARPTQRSITVGTSGTGRQATEQTQSTGDRPLRAARPTS
jgi:ketosteroid isomerase-like protein